MASNSKPSRNEENRDLSAVCKAPVWPFILMAYLLDTNVFITAKQRYYGFQLCPGFWDWLIDANGRGLVFSHQQVLSELTAIGDELATWAAGPGVGLFL